MQLQKIKKLENYLHNIFGSKKIKLRKREQVTDSVEFLIEDETFGLIYQDEEDGETCYHIQLTIFDEDLN